MNDLFEFTSEVMDKKLFESLKDYNLSDKTSKQVLIDYLKQRRIQKMYPKILCFSRTRKERTRKYSIR